VTPRASAAISASRPLGLPAPGKRGGPLLNDSAGPTRVLYCSPSQANAVTEVRGYVVEDCGIVEVGAYRARSGA